MSRFPLYMAMLWAATLYLPLDVAAASRFRPPSFFFFNDSAPTEIYTLSLHDALPIYIRLVQETHDDLFPKERRQHGNSNIDRKSTRLNSSHLGISYAVFCLKKKRAEE